MMKKVLVLMAAFILFLHISGSIIVYGAIPASERTALIALYQATDGDGWKRTYGWKTPPLDADGFAMPGTEKDWYGITVSGDHVTEIGIYYNELDGTLPGELENLTHLTILAFTGSTDLTGDIPAELGNLSRLQELLLLDNNLNGTIPKELGKLDKLTTLLLFKNNLSGNIPKELGNLDNLTWLRLNNNNLDGSIPKELGNLANLFTLGLEYNQLTGGIPPELGNLKNLANFILNNNDLTGSIPKELGNLSNVGAFSLNNNDLTGPIPPGLGNLNGTAFLFLQDNQLEGGIPPELGNMTGLMELNLSDNRLEGSIPPELGNFKNLEGLNLSSNRLSGSIPSDIARLRYLQHSDPLTLKPITDFGYNALYTDDEDLRNFLSNRAVDWEKTQTISPGDISAAASSSFSIDVSWTPIQYTGNNGGYMVYYGPSPQGPWTYAGMTNDKSANSYEVTGLTAGVNYYFIVKTTTYSHGDNKNTLTGEAGGPVNCTIGSTPPFGSFDTPLDGSIVSSSVPVTGWALDDLGVESVKIYREAGGAAGLVYIGAAVFVQGARPDIEQGYPGYPNNHQAGWGYMMLTNFLPGSGNGTFKIHAIATDLEGSQVTLGMKTITCDNANAVKPFGAIDAPAQGDTVSGSRYVNWGWVLTPLPNTIPTDGSSIRVWVNGVPLGNPVYNLYRQDIASLFPDYNNSGGAVGYFYLDTTPYKNGVHTIYWTAGDNAGNSDGIGSRYFTIQNLEGATARDRPAAGTVQPPTFTIDFKRIPIDYSMPTRLKRGYNRNTKPQELYPDEKGDITIETGQLGRIELDLGDNGIYTGFQVVNNQLRALPIGSFLDSQKGIFYWQVGPGFIGEYRLVFIEGLLRAGDFNGRMRLKKITVRVGPGSPWQGGIRSH